MKNTTHLALIKNWYLAFALACAMGISIQTTGCFGPSKDRNAVTALALQRSAVEHALIGWNEYLGSQQRVVASMPEPEKSKRVAEIQNTERKIEAALVDYNKAQATARLAFDEYLAQKKLDAATAETTFSLVQVRIDQFKSAAAAVIEIIAVWVPGVKKN